ncbi:NAD-dependent epimerase/dehydratase family protein [Bacillus sp. 2205SS5-2]|uniref:NAD-dependent epimerase/dehydratase family protein n=1 Tax=Bacillus sp. 2205SS5-2 TaxID=3109031 RepID=UPI0030067E61
MNFLMIGGTNFLGRHIVQTALNRGHTVTLFNRGKSNASVFPDLEKIHGDRDGEIEKVAGRKWDAVIDTCGYFPRVVKQSVEQLLNQVDHYTFISSISVYERFSKIGMDENEAVGKLDHPTVEEITGATYGPLKVYCEQEVLKKFDQKALIIRPGLIVGPFDPTDRFTYWVDRIAKGGDVLIPNEVDAPAQFIDVRDLATWILSMVEKKQQGLFNATGPDYPLTLGEFLSACQNVLNPNTRFIPVSESFLISQKVGEWMELPLWIQKKEEMRGFSQINCEKALKSGLSFRPLAETIKDTYDWSETRTKDIEKRAGMNENREQDLLKKWTDLVSNT